MAIRLTDRDGVLTNNINRTEEEETFSHNISEIEKMENEENDRIIMEVTRTDGHIRLII